MLRRIFDWWPELLTLAAFLLLVALEAINIRWYGPLDPPDRIYDPEQAVEILKEIGLRD